MSANQKNTPDSLDTTTTPTEEEVAAEFGGELEDFPRSTIVDFGFPDDIDNIGTRNSDEFEATGEVTKNIANIDLGAMEQLASKYDASNVEFDASGVGALFAASTNLFATNTASPNDVAPPLPSFVKPVRTSFRSPKPLAKLQKDLIDVMTKCSVTYSPSEEQPFAYDCSVMRQYSLVEFEVRIFLDAKEHLVEVRHMRGCRYAFSEAWKDLAKELKVSFSGAGKPPAPPPPVHLANSLFNIDTKPSSSATTAVYTDETSTCAHVMQLLDKNASSTMRCQGCRSAGAMAASLCENMQSCELKGSCGADHKDHHLLFAEGGPWAKIAGRVAELANGADADGLLEYEEEEVRAVAMAAVATISQLQHVCSTWLSSAVTIAVGNTDDASPHVRREALRATEVLASRDKALATQAVRAGVVPTLELEAEGGQGDQPFDLAAQRFAQGALRACRA